MSPPLTRSARKKKKKRNVGLPPMGRSPPAAVDERTSGLILNFSPPDQEANRRREAQELAMKEKDR